MSTATKTTYTLDDYKTDAEKGLEDQKKYAKQSANINYQKLMKYLPDRLRADGTAGMAGLSESAQLAATADYQNALAAADSEYNAAHTELLNNYRLEKEAEQDELYNEIVTKIDSGEFNTTDELKKYLYGEDGKSGITQGLTEQQKQLIDGKWNFYANNPERITADEEYNNQVSKDASGNPVVKTNLKTSKSEISVTKSPSKLEEGKNFEIANAKVELGAEVDIGTLPKSISQIQDKETFLYNDAIYIKLGGKIFSVQGRGGEYDTDGYNDLLNWFKSGRGYSI